MAFLPWLSLTFSPQLKYNLLSEASIACLIYNLFLITLYLKTLWILFTELNHNLELTNLFTYSFLPNYLVDPY